MNQVDLNITQGSNFTIRATVTQKLVDSCVNDCVTVPVNLTAQVVRAQVRRGFDSQVAVTFTTVTTNALEGEFELRLTAEQTRTMTAGAWVWDCEMASDDTDTAEVYQAFRGNVTVTPEATR
jgi:hypothetical protein